MSSKKFPLLIFVFVLLLVVAGLATLAYHKGQKKEEMMESTNANPTSSITNSSDAQLDQDSQNIDTSLNSLNTDLNTVDTSLNDQPTNLQ